MTKEEKAQVMDYINELHQRINKAKSEIEVCNYGTALYILSKAYPYLKIKVKSD